MVFYLKYSPKEVDNSSEKSRYTSHNGSVVSPALWNDTPPGLQSAMLQGMSHASLRSLKTFLFTCLSRWEHLWI